MSREEIRRQVKGYVQGLQAYAKTKHDGTEQARVQLDGATKAGASVCQNYAEHEAHAEEYFRGMKDELTGFRQLAASEARIKGEAIKAFNTAAATVENGARPHCSENEIKRQALTVGLRNFSPLLA